MKQEFAWKRLAREVTPYIPGEQPQGSDIVKLNTNENPYPPAPGVYEVLAQFDASRLRKYPDPMMLNLRQAIADYHKVSVDEVFVGVGSDDVLAMCFLSFFADKNQKVLFPDITYSFYDVWAKLFQIPFSYIPVDENLCIVPSDYSRENGGIVIANPNAPTSMALPIESLLQIVEGSPASVVLMDEAYIDFGGDTMLPYIHTYDNLLVIRTFSKSRAMAGARIGYAIGNKELISQLFAVRNSFNSYTMDPVSMAVGVASIKDQAYFEDRVAEIIATREQTKERLHKLGFSFLDAKANFIFATHKEYKARDLFAYLRKQNIFVRYFDKPRIDHYLRITIGTPEEMDKLFYALEAYPQYSDKEIEWTH